MKTLVPKQLGVMMIALVAISAMATYAITSFDNGPATQKSTAQLLGHLEVIVRDSEGFIKAYRQSDNAIVSNGMTIIANQVFSGANTTAGRVSHMDIGRDNTGMAWNNAALGDDIGGSCARQLVTWTKNAPVDEGSGFAQVSINGTATFTGANCADASIDEAGVFTLDTAGEMFARNTFNTVNLQSADSLQLNWDFVFTDS